LVPVALGLVEESNTFSSSTGAAVLPYHPTEEEELSEKDMRIQAIDVPAECHFLGTQNNKYACSLRLSDVEDCWNKIVSDNTKIESLLPNGTWKTEQERVSAAMCLLLNGVYMRYDGLRDTSCWAKLFQRLLHVGKIRDMHTVTAQDFSIESPWDLCHLTYLLFDLVIDKVSLGVIDGLLRTLVARMIATWREQQRQIHPLSTPLKYPLDLFPIGLASVAKAITIDVFNVKGRSELLDAKHGQLLRDRSHCINADSDAGTARGMRDNLMAFINWCQQEDRQILKVGCGIKKKDLASAFLGIRNKAIEHLRHNPDVHTKVNKLEGWRELLMSSYMVRNMHSLLGSFPGRSHKASNMMCTLSTLCLNRKCLNVLLTFVQLNGCGGNFPADKKFNVSHSIYGIWSSKCFPHFLYVLRQSQGFLIPTSKKKKKKEEEGPPIATGFFPSSHEKLPDWNVYGNVWRTHVFRPALLLVEIWLSSLEPRRPSWLSNNKLVVQRISNLHAIPQVLQLLNIHGPVLSISEKTRQTMPCFSQYMDRGKEVFGSNLSVLVSIICFSCARTMYGKQIGSEFIEEMENGCIYFSHDDNVIASAFGGKHRSDKQLLPGKFELFDPTFALNERTNAKEYSLHELTSVLLGKTEWGQESHLEVFQNAFDTMVSSFPMDDVLLFLEGSPQMQLSELVSKWVLDGNQDSACDQKIGQNLRFLQCDQDEAPSAVDELEAGHCADSLALSTLESSSTSLQGTSNKNARTEEQDQGNPESSGMDRASSGCPAVAGGHAFVQQMPLSMGLKCVETYIDREDSFDLDNSGGMMRVETSFGTAKKKCDLKYSRMLVSTLKQSLGHHQAAMEHHVLQMDSLKESVQRLETHISQVEEVRTEEVRRKMNSQEKRRRIEDYDGKENNGCTPKRSKDSARLVGIQKLNVSSFLEFEAKEEKITCPPIPTK